MDQSRVIVDRSDVVAFGKSGRAQFWLSRGTASPPTGVHICVEAPNRAAVRAFHAAALNTGAPTMDPPAFARTTVPTTTAHSCSTSTATMSRRSAATKRTK